MLRPRSFIAAIVVFAILYGTMMFSDKIRDIAEVRSGGMALPLP
jgi:hypothetical protein